MSIHKAREHMEYHHGGADGWITVARKEGGGFIQRHYRVEEAGAALSEWIGEDVYFSQNTFYRPFRRVENVRQLRAVYVDVDHYLLNFAPEWVIGKMEAELFGQSVPEPNLIIHSGRGFVVVWLLEPVPGKKLLPLWQAVEQHFAAQFRSFGGDPRATDAARVFRIAGSVNSKSGMEVTVQYRHACRYELRQLQADYLPELRQQKAKKGRLAKAAQLYNVHRLHHARLLDMVKLVELRGYAVKGCRETICFLYRYWSSCFLADEEEALRQTLELNDAFTEPLPEREVMRATKSAAKAYRARNDQEANRIAREQGYPGAGYNVSSQKLIEWLDITAAEQRELGTIIGKDEKRKRLYAARREAGVVSRAQYIAEQREITAEKLEALREALAANPDATKRELAEELGVTIRRIEQLLKK